MGNKLFEEEHEQFWGSEEEHEQFWGKNMNSHGKNTKNITDMIFQQNNEMKRKENFILII